MSYDFSVLRELRKRKKLTINELSKLCGISYVALSKLERNQANPELRTLDCVSRSLGISACNLLAMAEHKQPLLASEKTCKIMDQAECRHIDLQGTRILLVKAPKGSRGDGAEFHGNNFERCFVLEGRVRITINRSDYVLGPGEGLSWDSVLEHVYDAIEPATFITVLTPKGP